MSCAFWVTVVFAEAPDMLNVISAFLLMEVVFSVTDSVTLVCPAAPDEGERLHHVPSWLTIEDQECDELTVNVAVVALADGVDDVRLTLIDGRSSFDGASEPPPPMDDPPPPPQAMIIAARKRTNAAERTFALIFIKINLIMQRK